MASNTTSIKGSALNNKCKMQAAYLSQLIYKDPLGKEPFKTCYPDEIKAAEANWDVWEDFNYNAQNGSGIVARLYKPKGYKEGVENDEAMCWPTLVFRGTDMDDFRGVAFWFAIRSMVGEENLVKSGHRKEGEPFFEHVFTFDNTLPNPPPGGYTKKNLSEYSGKKFNEVTLLETKPFITMNSIRSDVFRVQASLLLAENGDWTNNILQGMGKESRQYNDALAIAHNIYYDYILKKK